MKLVWSPEAIEDLREVLRDSTGEDSLASAIETVKRIVTFVASQLLSGQVNGRWSPFPNVRLLAIEGTPFEVPYRTGPDHIEILRVFDSGQVWSDS